MIRFLQRILFYSFRRFYSLEYRLNRRFSTAGKMVLLGLIISAVLGVDTKLTLIFQIFSLFGSLLFISFLSVLFFRGQFSVKRNLPRFMTAGSPFSYEIVVGNLKNRTETDLKLLEVPPDPRPDFDTFLNTREPGEKERNLFDRKIAYHRFVWLCKLRIGLKFEEVALSSISGHDTVTTKIKVTPLRRGVFRIHGSTLAREDSFGLIRSFSHVTGTSEILVFPKRYSLPPGFKISGGRRYQLGDDAQGGGVGDSEEFVGLRDYREGDSLRKIHWPSLAKIGKPVVKEFQEEYCTRYGLILDTYAEVASEQFEDAVSLAASVAVDQNSNEFLLDIMFVSRRVFRLTLGRGVGQASQALEALALVQPTPENSIDTLTNMVMSSAYSVSGLLLILLIWDDDRQNFLRKLQSMGIKVIVWVVVAKGGYIAQLKGKTHIGDSRVQVLEAGNILQGLG
jgi:uncharacterized protein (DUF58 family)